MVIFPFLDSDTEDDDRDRYSSIMDCLLCSHSYLANGKRISTEHKWYAVIKSTLSISSSHSIVLPNRKALNPYLYYYNLLHLKFPPVTLYSLQILYIQYIITIIFIFRGGMKIRFWISSHSTERILSVSFHFIVY